MGYTIRTQTFDEPVVLSDVVKFYESDYSTEVATIASGEGVLEIGTVLGRVTTGAATSVAKSGGNTGNGTLTLDVSTPVLAGAKSGVYTVRCIAAAANSGTFRVEDPDGNVIGDVAVAATFSDDIKFVIADGASDFIVGDGFDITVAAGSSKWKAANADALDGSQVARAILAEKIDATSADKSAVIIARRATVSRLGLRWHANTNTTNERNAAIAQLADAGIITREGA